MGNCHNPILTTVSKYFKKRREATKKSNEIYF
jgi:hypothetical protein